MWAVQPDVPYDERSHWATVLFYAHHAALPVLGHPGVTYEAQQGPLAYAVDAVLVRVTQSLGFSLMVAFRVVRLAGVLELGGAVLVMASLAKRLLPSAWAAAGATAVFGLSPMLLTMSASVQNDTLALLLGLVAVQLALVLLDEHPTIGSAALVGAVAGLAVLAKLTAWAAVVAIAAWLLWRHRRRGAEALFGFLAMVAALTGWWFVRNAVLYGDPSASAGIGRLGFNYPRYHIHGLSGLGHVVEEVVTYLWLPTEYVRNAIAAPGVLKALLVAATAGAVVIGSVTSRKRLAGRSAATLVLGCGALAFAGWLALFLGVEASPPRLAYLALPAWVTFVGLGLIRVPRLYGLAGVALLLIAINVWTLHEISAVKTPFYDRPAIAAVPLARDLPRYRRSPRPQLSARGPLREIGSGAVARKSVTTAGPSPCRGLWLISGSWRCTTSRRS